MQEKNCIRGRCYIQTADMTLRNPDKPGMTAQGIRLVRKRKKGKKKSKISLAIPVFFRADAFRAAENLREITQRGKTEQLCNLGHGKIGFGQQVHALLDTLGDHIVDW